MNPDDDEIRVSFTLYPSDTRVLRRLNLALRDQGLDVVRTDTFRALLHLSSEAELFAFAALRLKQEAAGTLPQDEQVEERFTVRMKRGVVKKLDRVVDDLARKDLDTDRSFVARAALHGDHDLKAFFKAAKAYLAGIPDLRTRAARGKRRA